MSRHRKTITLTAQQDEWVKDQIALLRQALAEGESSGKTRPPDISAIKAAGRKRMKATN